MDRPLASPARPRGVLVLGAAGRFGCVAVRAFAESGWRVLAQVRRDPGALPDGVVRIDAPLDDTDRLAAAAAGADVVVYAVNPPYGDWERRMLPLARRGMDVAARLGATFMLPGNVYNHGESMPARLDESTPERPGTPMGRLRVALERELAERAARGELRAVVIRAGDFYGAGRGAWMDLAIVRSIGAGRLVYPGPLDVPHAWAYLPDLARAFVAVASRQDAPAFERLHFAGHTMTGRELLAALEAAADGLGLRPAGGWRHARMPWGWIRALGWVSPSMRDVLRMRYLWSVPHALDGAALRRAVGPLASTPPHEALRAALVELGHGPRPRPVVAAG